MVVFGTRPEAIKLCPLISALRAHTELECKVCVTAQHREMLDQALAAFDVQPDYDLNVMRPGQSLTALTSRLLASLEPVILELKPGMIVVQGDTTTTFSAALAGFYAGVSVSHVEAGLRTFDFHAPFPEEMNRTLTGRLAHLHFAPTKRAADNLRREGVPPDRIEVTGNTGIDAVLTIRDALERGDLPEINFPVQSGKRLILVTAHRRESFGEGFCHIMDAIRELAQRDDVEIVWPVHPNPQISGLIHSRLGNEPNIRLLEPVEYVSFVDLMRRAYLILTDSGGIQEEAPSLGKPVLVLREKTERPEAVEVGTVKLVGSDQTAIVREAARLLEDRPEYDRIARIHNPYGDGQASARIARRIQDYLR